MPTIDLNLLLKAPTQYISASFTSYANFNGFVLGTSSDGLSQVCCGDSDNGDDIEAYFTPMSTDFGIKSPKRLRYVYLGFQSTANLELNVYVDDKVVRTYTVKANKSGQQRTRVTIGRDGKGRYWSIKVKNTSGCSFAIDSIQVMPVILSEGFK